MTTDLSTLHLDRQTEISSRLRGSHLLLWHKSTLAGRRSTLWFSSRSVIFQEEVFLSPFTFVISSSFAMHLFSLCSKSHSTARADYPSQLCAPGTISSRFRNISPHFDYTLFFNSSHRQMFSSLLTFPSRSLTSSRLLPQLSQHM